MTWTSDRAGVLLYSILGTVLVLSWIYIPASGRPTQRRIARIDLLPDLAALSPRAA